jgi:hypothetical protein
VPDTPTVRVRWIHDEHHDIPAAGGVMSPDSVFEVPGVVVGEAEHLEYERRRLGLAAGDPVPVPDHVLIRNGDDLTAWPLTRYRVETAAPRAAKPKE